jgi:pectate lyase
MNQFLRSTLLFFLLTTTIFAEKNKVVDLLKQPDSWFASKAATQAATIILSYQSPRGAWPKNINTAGEAYTGDPEKIDPTFDNGATTDELRFLARLHRAQASRSYEKAFIRGLDYIHRGQYRNGGWPQFHPPGNKYHRHITFNDGSMVRLLEFLREIADPKKHPQYQFLTDQQRTKAGSAFDQGIQCILRCQIIIDGKPTVWCAQHDEVSFQPALARSYELPSLSGSESVGITRLLMSIDEPSPEIIRAIEAAVAWFTDHALYDISIEEIKNKDGKKDRAVVKDRKAPRLWARFYDLKTQQPLFCDRDGIPLKTYAELGHERRNGYAWYGNWAENLLEKNFPKWKKSLPLNKR